MNIKINLNNNKIKLYYYIILIIIKFNDTQAHLGINFSAEIRKLGKVKSIKDLKIIGITEVFQFESQKVVILTEKNY